MNTNYTDIRALLERFYSGETTLAEEQQLMDFFTTETNLPTDLAKEAVFFKAIQVSEEDVVPADLPEKIQARIAPSYRRIVPYKRIAAAVVGVIMLASASIGGLMYQREQAIRNFTTCESQEEADKYLAYALEKLDHYDAVYSERMESTARMLDNQQQLIKKSKNIIKKVQL